MYKKDGKVFQNEEEYLSELPEMTEEKKKKSKGCLIAFLITVGVLGLLIFALYKVMVPIDYRVFTESRIKSLEKEYNMDLGSAKLKRYWVPSMAQDNYDCLRFSVSDYSDFMENNFFGEIISFNESDDKSSARYICRPYYNSNDDRERRFTFLVKFQKSGDGYEADLTSYYDRYTEINGSEGT